MTTTAVRERPILFSAPMVRAILDGRKTQTRRVIKWKIREKGLNLGFSGLESGFYCSDLESSGWVLRSRGGASGCWNDRTFPLHCPYGFAGDRLWVRECFSKYLYRPGAYYWADGDKGCKFDATRPKPSIHMPRALCRIRLEIMKVRVERLRDITEKDAQAEGVERGTCTHPDCSPGSCASSMYRTSFATLWNSINAKRGFGWMPNPWVWVIEFRSRHAGQEE